MSIAAWYEHKAEQCSRLAREATDARQRAQLMEEAALWREIARDLADREHRDAVSTQQLQQPQPQPQPKTDDKK